MSHLTQKQLHSLLRGSPLPPEGCDDALLRERAALLEHALACEDCAALLYQANTELPEIAPPAGMERRILEAARERPRQESLRAYTLRVFAAMAAALLLLFTGTFQRLAQLPQELPEISQSIQTQIVEFIDLTKEGFHFASESK